MNSLIYSVCVLEFFMMHIVHAIWHKVQEKSRTKLLEESSIGPVKHFARFEDTPFMEYLILSCFIN